MTISNPRNAVDGTIAAVILPAVEEGYDTVESHINEVDDVNVTVP
jgi:hypothetical protein